MKGMEKTVRAWMKNPFWREYYEQAPSGKCRELIALEFRYSDGDGDPEELLREMGHAEAELGLEDWKHLFRYCGNNPRKKIIHDRIAEMARGIVDKPEDSSHT